MKTLDSKRYKLVYGDIFDYIDRIDKKVDIIIPHVCSNNGKFNTGFASVLGKKYPEVKINYEISHVHKMGENQKVKVDNKVFINMICQNGEIARNNPRPLNYFSLARCLAEVRYFIKNTYNDSDIKTCQLHCPKFGTGSSGGNWNFISDLIEDVWLDLDVFIYSYKRE